MAGSILIVYGLMQHPLRSTVEDHLYSFRRYSRARCFYANVMLGPVPRWMRKIEHEAIIFHTSLLSAMRWAPASGEALLRRAVDVSDGGGVRVALPQDEFLRADDLCRFIEDCSVDLVLSVAPPSEWPKIYAGVDRERVRFEQVLTGYLDERTVGRIERITAETRTRRVDLSYRAGTERPYLGRHGLLKTRIATAAEPRAAGRGLRTDISLRPEDALLGDDWFRHLAESRWTLGVEGGASILDRDGTIRERTERYLAEHPGADFDAIEAACFPGRDGELSLFAVSPRHLEACATRTAQVLVEGEYSGILQANRQYLPLRSDLSNLDEVLDALTDEQGRLELTENAYREVVASGRYSYRAFVGQVEALLALVQAEPAWPARVALGGLHLLASARDRGSWLRVAYRLRWRPSLWTLLARLRGRSASEQRPPARASGPTVVSVTPARLEADSRTLKEAVSFARLGYRSIVLEGLPSEIDWNGLPLEVSCLRLLGNGAQAGRKDNQREESEPGAGPRALRAARLLHPLARLAAPFLSLLAVNRETLSCLPPADLYWLHGPRQFPAVFLCAWRNRSPFVYDAHDFYADAARNNPSLTRDQRRALWLDRLVERLCVRLAAARVTVAPGVASLQERRFGRPFQVLHNAHDPRLDREPTSDLRATIGLDQSDFLVAMVGNSKRGTAFEAAFSALTALPPHVHLAFVGRDYSEARRRADEHGVGRRVHFLDPVPPNEVANFIRTADVAGILYYPLTSNFLSALPNRLYQALSAGLPVLYPADMTAIRELAERHELGLAIDPRSPSSLTSAIMRLLEEPDTVALLRENARRAAAVLNWEHEEARLSELVTRLVAGEGRPAQAHRPTE